MSRTQLIFHHHKQPSADFHKIGVLINFTNSQENPCARVSSLIKLQAFIKKETSAQVFSCKFYKIFKNTYFTEYFRASASVPWHIPFQCIALSHPWLDGTVKHNGESSVWALDLYLGERLIILEGFTLRGLCRERNYPRSQEQQDF